MVEADAAPDGPIGVDRATFDAMLATLAAEGVSLPSDGDATWRAWAGWRVNYDQVVGQLAELTATDRVPPA